MQKYVIREDLHTAGHIEAWADYQLEMVITKKSLL